MRRRPDTLSTTRDFQTCVRVSLEQSSEGVGGSRCVFHGSFSLPTLLVLLKDRREYVYLVRRRSTRLGSLQYQWVGILLCAAQSHICLTCLFASMSIIGIRLDALAYEVTNLIKT